MTVLEFQTPEEAFYRHFAREHLPARRTQDIFNDIKKLRMLGEEDAVLRGVLFAELAVRVQR
jgi:hypothetical protein